MDWWVIVSYVVGILGVVLGAIFSLKWGQAVTFLKELGDAFTKTGVALEDKNLTQEEATALLKEWREVVEAFLAILPNSVKKLFEK